MKKREKKNKQHPTFEYKNHPILKKITYSYSKIFRNEQKKYFADRIFLCDGIFFYHDFFPYPQQIFMKRVSLKVFGKISGIFFCKQHEECKTASVI